MMKLSSSFILTSGLMMTFAFTSFAQPAAPVDTSAFCQSDQSTIVQRTRLNFEPNYFAKLYAVQNFATVIVNSKTYVVNLATGKLTNVEGTYDPVPTPDEKFLVTIEHTNAADDGPLYFESADVLDHATPSGGFSRWTAGNFNISYAYQSIGWLPRAVTGPLTYRFLCDNNGGTVYFRDDYFTSQTDGLHGVNSGKWILACHNFGTTLKLPMISKDGQLLSVYNVNKGATQVYDLDDKGQCTNPKTLPFVTGKTDISFDRTKVAFHMGRLIEPSHWFETADPARKLDTFVYDMKTKQLTRLTDVETGNAYFPTFKKDGKVGFLLQEKIDGKRRYSYVIADPSRGVTLDQFPDLQDKTNASLANFGELAAIGLLKDRVCKTAKQSYTLESETAVPLTLTHDQCLSLIETYWDASRDDVLKMVTAMKSSVSGRKQIVANRLKLITKNQLEAVCSGKGRAAITEVPVVGSQAIATTTNAVERLQQTCAKCHAGQKPASGLAFNLQDILSMPLRTRSQMAKMIVDGTMPPGGLNENERGHLSDYLLGRAPASTR